MDFNKMSEMLSQATAMREQMEQRMAETVVEAQSGGGAVTARVNGKKELLKITIAPSAASSAADAGVPGSSVNLRFGCDWRNVELTMRLASALKMTGSIGFESVVWI